jgi:hypothetical protein
MHRFSGLLIYILFYPTVYKEIRGRKFNIDTAHYISILKPLSHNSTESHIDYTANYDLCRQRVISVLQYILGRTLLEVR